MASKIYYKRETDHGWRYEALGVGRRPEAVRTGPYYILVREQGKYRWQKHLSDGFLLLVLVVAALITEMIDRNFNRAAIWCALASVFSWVGLMHSPVIKWGAQPM